MNNEPIFSRRSIRKFKNTEISRETIREIIEAGIAAPSAKNRQPWKCFIFQGKRKAELLDVMQKGIEREQLDPMLPEAADGLSDAKNTLRIMRGAPVIIMILGRGSRSPFEPVGAEKRISEICDTLSIGAFIENMLLFAEKRGIGSLWIANTCYAYKELTEYLSADGQLVSAVALGYADESPSARPRRGFDDIAEFMD